MSMCVRKTRRTPVRLARPAHRWPVEVGGAWRDRAGSERDLGEEVIARPDQRLQVARTPAIAAVHEAVPLRVGHPKAVALPRMRDPGRLDLEGADDMPARRERLDVEGCGAEARFRMQGVDPIGQPGRAHDTDAARVRRTPAEEMAQRHEVDEMVGMEVADQDGVEGTRIQQAGQPRQRPLAEIEQDRSPVVPDEVGGTSRAWSVGEGGAGADHVQPKCRAIRLRNHAPKRSGPGGGSAAQVTRFPEDATAGRLPWACVREPAWRLPARGLASAWASGGVAASGGAASWPRHSSLA